MSRFMALVAVLYRKIGLDRASRPGARIRWELDLDGWDPDVANQRQREGIWTCEIVLPAPSPVPSASILSVTAHGRGNDGAAALTAAIAELDRMLGREPHA